MLDPRQPRLPAQPPSVAPPPRFVERRVAYRRAEDQRVHEERVVPRPCPRQPGRRRAGRGTTRRTAEADRANRRREARRDPRRRHRAPVRRLGRRRRRPGRRRGARRVARRDGAIARGRSAPPSAPAPVSILEGGAGRSGRRRRVRLARAPPPRRYALLRVPGPGGVVLGFEFGSRESGMPAARPAPAAARSAMPALPSPSSPASSPPSGARRRSAPATPSGTVSSRPSRTSCRTPLTGLRGYLELILGGKVDDPAVERDFLVRSRRSSGRWASWSATCSSCPGWSRARSSWSSSRSPWPNRRAASPRASCRSRSSTTSG